MGGDKRKHDSGQDSPSKKAKEKSAPKQLAALDYMEKTQNSKGSGEKTHKVSSEGQADSRPKSTSDHNAKQGEPAVSHVSAKPGNSRGVLELEQESSDSDSEKV